MIRDWNRADRVRDVELQRLLFIGSFAGGIETAAASMAIHARLGRADQRRVRSMIGAAQRLRRSYAALSPDARERLGESPRYARRAALARGILASVETPT
jgi:hypothetical protein